MQSSANNANIESNEFEKPKLTQVIFEITVWFGNIFSHICITHVTNNDNVCNSINTEGSTATFSMLFSGYAFFFLLLHENKWLREKKKRRFGIFSFRKITKSVNWCYSALMREEWLFTTLSSCQNGYTYLIIGMNKHFNSFQLAKKSG